MLMLIVILNFIILQIFIKFTFQAFPTSKVEADWNEILSNQQIQPSIVELSKQSEYQFPNVMKSIHSSKKYPDQSETESSKIGSRKKGSIKSKARPAPRKPYYRKPSQKIRSVRSLKNYVKTVD